MLKFYEKPRNARTSPITSEILVLYKGQGLDWAKISATIRKTRLLGALVIPGAPVSWGARMMQMRRVSRR